MMLGQNELMNSRLSGSEEALATLSCRQIEGVKRPHILIGGLGMGFTLRAALAVLSADARVTVAELVPEVIAWARGPMVESVWQQPERPARQHCPRRCGRLDRLGGFGVRCRAARCR